MQQNMIIIKLHVNGLEAMDRYINSVTSGQERIKGHFSAHFVKKYIKKLISVISIPKANRSIDKKKSLQTNIQTDRQTNIITEKAKTRE